MKAEIISVGSKLLRGQIANVDAEFLSRQLTALGMIVEQCTMIGHDSEKLKEAVRKAEERAELIVVSGGLGPSDDDITKTTLSEYLEVPLVLDRETEDRIITYHKNSDFTMPENNQLQALVFQGSVPLQNVTGLAAGMFYQTDNHAYLLVPGPFDELKPMFEKEIRPLLIDRLVEENAVASRTLRFYGLTEAQMNKELEDIVQENENPVLIVLPEGEEMTAELTARAETEDAAEQLLQKAEDTIRQRIGDFFFGYGQETLFEVVKELLKEKNLTITAAESLTGGAFLSALSSELEAGMIFEGGVVTYSSEMKNQVLGVPKETIETYGVVSAQCAVEMAEKAREMFQADIGVSLTGAAGPSSLEGQIPGTVWIGVAEKGQETFAKHYHFAYKRNKNRRQAVMSAMQLVHAVLKDEEIEDKVLMDHEAGENK